jgi:hypothetical protein
MENGFYFITLKFENETGFCLMILSDGQMSGMDSAGLIYKGVYKVEDDRVVVKFAASAQNACKNSFLITGVPAQDFHAEFSFPVNSKGKSFALKIPGGNVRASFGAKNRNLGF